MYDLVIKGGWVYGADSGEFTVCDIGIQGGKIEKIGNVESEGAITVDGRGLYVTPGLIDMHCHIFPTFPFSKDCLPTIHPDVHMPASGVTTAVDAGTCGFEDFPIFKSRVIDLSPIRIFAFLNIAKGGMVHLSSEQDLADFNSEKAGELAFRESCIVGIKTAHYWADRPFDAIHHPWDSVDQALKAGEIAGKPVMVDFKPYGEERSYKKLLEKLRKGDIHTHIYAKHFELLDRQNRVLDFAEKARQKGIIFDLGHGEESFVFEHACPAYENGFYPDTISTDLYKDNVNGPAFNLVSLMSKYLAIGMPLEEVVFRVTKRPAQVIGHPELGVLKEGGQADIALLKLREEAVSFPDCDGKRVDGTKNLECHMTICGGKVLYNPFGMGLPHWKRGAAKGKQ